MSPRGSTLSARPADDARLLVLHEAGGHVIVQDEESSVVWGMPGYVARAGLADKVLPLGDIAREIALRVQGGAAGVEARLRAGALR